MRSRLVRTVSWSHLADRLLQYPDASFRPNKPEAHRGKWEAETERLAARRHTEPNLTIERSTSMGRDYLTHQHLIIPLAQAKFPMLWR